MSTSPLDPQQLHGGVENATRKHGGGGVGPNKPEMGRNHEMSCFFFLLSPPLHLPTGRSETQQLHVASLRTFFVTQDQSRRFIFRETKSLVSLTLDLLSCLPRAVQFLPLAPASQGAPSEKLQSTLPEALFYKKPRLRHSAFFFFIHLLGQESAELFFRLGVPTVWARSEYLVTSRVPP